MYICGALDQSEHIGALDQSRRHVYGSTVLAREFLFATEVGVTLKMADFLEKGGDD